MASNDLDGRLGDYLESLIDPVSPREVLDASGGRRARRRWPWLAAAAFLGFVALGAAWRYGADRSDDAQLSTSNDDEAAVSVATIDEPVWWELAPPPPPRTPREDPVSAWVDDKWVVWGGSIGGTWQPDGASFDPTEGAWRTITAPRNDSFPDASAANDRELFVVRVEAGRVVVDRYDPVADEWTTTEPSEAFETSGSAVADVSAVWVGERLVVLWTVTGAEGLAVSGASFDPETDRWVEIAALTSPGGIEQIVYTPQVHGDTLFVWVGGVAPSGQVTAGLWRRTSGPDGWAEVTDAAADVPFVDASTFSIDGQLIVWGGRPVACLVERTCENQPPEPSAGALVDPETGQVDPILSGPVDRGGDNAVAADGELYTINEWYVADDDGGLRWFPGEAAAFDPRTRQWRSLSTTAPDESSGHHPRFGIVDVRATVWADDRWFIVGSPPTTEPTLRALALQPMPDFVSACVAPLDSSQQLPPPLVPGGVPGARWEGVSGYLGEILYRPPGPPPTELWATPLLNSACEQVAWLIPNAWIVPNDDLDRLDFRWFVDPVDEDQQLYARPVASAVASVAIGENAEPIWIADGADDSYPQYDPDTPLPGDYGVTLVAANTDTARWGPATALEVGDKVRIRINVSSLGPERARQLWDLTSLSEAGLSDPGADWYPESPIVVPYEVVKTYDAGQAPSPESVLASFEPEEAPASAIAFVTSTNNDTSQIVVLTPAPE